MKSCSAISKAIGPRSNVTAMAVRCSGWGSKRRPVHDYSNAIGGFIVTPAPAVWSLPAIMRYAEQQ
jgi:hypothetical protein